MARPSWGHVSRHCYYCGQVGPRMHLAGVQIETGIVLPFGHAHKRCLPAEVLRKLGQIAREEAKRQATLPGTRGVKPSPACICSKAARGATERWQCPEHGPMRFHPIWQVVRDTSGVKGETIERAGMGPKTPLRWPSDEEYAQFQRDRIAEANRHDAEQAKPRLSDGVPPSPAPQPVAWIRRHPDGAFTGELLLDENLEEVRKRSGAWVPLGRIDRVSGTPAPDVLPKDADDRKD